MDFSSESLDQMLSQARAALESMRRGEQTDSSHDAEPVEGHGEAADGRIKVTAVTGGRVSAIEIDPRAMRMGSQEMAEQMLVAVNAALDDLRARTTASTAAEVPDLAALGRLAEDIQNQGLRQMELIRQSVNDTIARLGGGR